MNKYKGTFVVVEGLDGTGKSTTERVLKHNLALHGKSIVLTHEPFMNYPDGKPYVQGQKMFKRIDNPKEPLTHEQTQKMFMTNGKEHMEKVIIPALKQGKTVVCDRGLLSTLAYQGNYKNVHGKVIDVNHIMEKNKHIQGSKMVKPDVNIYLHLDDRDEIDRITGRAIGTTHKVDKFDRSLTQTKKLHHMRRQYHYALRDMKQKLHVPYQVINAKLQPEQRAYHLNSIIRETKLTKTIKILKHKLLKQHLAMKSSHKHSDFSQKLKHQTNYVKPLALALLNNNKTSHQKRSQQHGFHIS